MSGVLGGLRVLELSSGIAGPLAGMLLCDNGAQTTRIERPEGDPFSGLPGYRVWHRGKRSATLDLRDPEDRARFLALAAEADVLLEDFAPGALERLGIGHPILAALNPRLVICSITAYGSSGRHAHRPGYDALVAARTGLQWEQRGWQGGNVHRLAGAAPPLAGLEIPEGCIEGAPRAGPLFSYSAWPSLGAAFLAAAAISAALLARETTGRGQLVETSLLQGVMAATCMTWQRFENPDADGLWSWVFDGRSPKGFFKCADGRWVQQWVQRPGFVLGASHQDELRVPDNFEASRHDSDRLGPGPEDLVALFHYQPLMVEAFSRFPSDQWVAEAARASVPLQPVRTAEEALADPDSLAAGYVAVVEDPDLGPIRQVGLAYRMERSPGGIRGPAPRPGQHTAEVRAEADELLRRPATPPAAPSGRSAHAPLDGIRVLDLGTAVAGPWGAQVLSDLGADVIKINSLTDANWYSKHIAFSCNRGKRSLAVNLKDPRGLEVLHRLVDRADVVHHNMRYAAAQRLGVDYESLRAVNPRLVYCHTLGFEPEGARAQSPGNDQTGAALSGVEWEDGGCADGGRPHWSLTSLGDTGNGFLSATAVIQALYHRLRTGEGQMVRTSILSACLLNASRAYLCADGTSPSRDHLDANQTGTSALYRIYPGTDGWLCLAALTVVHWERLCAVFGPALADDSRFATVEARAAHDRELTGVLAEIIADRAVQDTFELLDRHGVPVEVSSATYSLEMWDDEEMREKQWIASYRQGHVGQMEQYGLLFDFSDTPARIAGPPLVVGDHSREILAEAGFSELEADQLVAEGVVAE